MDKNGASYTCIETIEDEIDKCSRSKVHNLLIHMEKNSSNLE